MSGKGNIIEDPPTGLFFVDPNTLPGYKPAKKVYFKEALAYAEKVKAEENREVTFEEMQQFAER
ncbi:MAG: hypothetical protein IKP29_07660 [Pseudobutyrivibrio sp.]|nr:hypothetical protein [Pseudobutyrivibrio sp.]